MNQKGLIAAIAALIIIVAVILMQRFSGPDLAPYLHLKDPAIRTMTARKVLVVEARGAPDQTAKKAFGLLLRGYFGLKGVPKGKGMPAPCARWAGTQSIAPQQWIGRYAMPLPDTVRDIRFPEIPKGMSMNIATWSSGEVAEILYIGPYSAETRAIVRLHDFITERGYVIAGEHEEEYLKGPGMVFRGNPKRYMTIIRYQVRKAEADTSAIVADQKKRT
jgi:hypothetical protein